VRPSVRSSVTSDKVHVRPIRVNVLLTLNRVNLDLLCCGRIRLAEGAYGWLRGAYAGGEAHTPAGGAHTPVGGAHTPAQGAHTSAQGACTAAFGAHTASICYFRN
jgi:hypothetical protein